MTMTRPFIRVATIPFAVLLCSAPRIVGAAQPPPSSEVRIGTVSDTLADMARQQADKGRLYEEKGLYGAALQQYREAIAELDKYFDQPSNHAAGNPKAFLVRGSAAADAARALSRSPGVNDPAGVRAFATRAESDFSTVLRITKPTDAESQQMIQKATLGRGYARLLVGNLVDARADLQGLKVGQMVVAQQQVSGAVTRLNSEIAAQAKTPPGPQPKPDKVTAVMNFGQELAKAFFPKYQGLAVATGQLVDAFRK